MLQRSGADTVVTAPGAFPFDNAVKSYPGLRHLIWVVDEGNKHLDWNEVPKGMGGSVNVSTWQDILNDNPVDAGTELPEVDPKAEIQDVIIFWQSKPGDLEEMVRFTQGNLVSAISAQLTAVPQKERFSPADLFLPSASLSASFPLVLTLAALYSNASVAFNSVAGTKPDLALATAGVAPTIIVATPQPLKKTHDETVNKVGASFLSKLSHWIQTRSLVQDGAMPVASFLASYNDSLRPKIGTAPTATPASCASCTSQTPPAPALPASRNRPCLTFAFSPAHASSTPWPRPASLALSLRPKSTITASREMAPVRTSGRDQFHRGPTT